MSITLPVLRRSAIQTASSCLYRYKKHWIDGVDDHSDFSLRGIGFHACAHRYIVRLVEKQLPADEEEAKLAFKEGIANALTPSHVVPEVHSIYVPWAENFGLDLEWFMAAEEHQVGKDNRQTFTPDLVYARPTALDVVDFKTYWSGMTETQIRNDFQTKFYIYNAMRLWPNFPEYGFTHSYVRFGTSVRVTFKPSDLDYFADEVEAVAASIEAASERDEWPATAGPECAFCSLKCPLVDHPAIVPKRFTVPDQARLIGGWILAAQQQVKTAKKALKAYCAANGKVDVQGVEWDNRPVQERTYPVDKVLKTLRDRNIFGAFDDTGLTISHSALAKLFKSFPQLEEDLLPFQHQKTSYRFGAKKPGVGEDEDE